MAVLCLYQCALHYLPLCASHGATPASYAKYHAGIVQACLAAEGGGKQGVPEGQALVQPARSHDAPSRPSRMAQVRACEYVMCLCVSECVAPT